MTECGMQQHTIYAVFCPFFRISFHMCPKEKIFGSQSWYFHCIKTGNLYVNLFAASNLLDFNFSLLFQILLLLRFFSLPDIVCKHNSCGNSFVVYTFVCVYVHARNVLKIGFSCGVTQHFWRVEGIKRLKRRTPIQALVAFVVLSGHFSWEWLVLVPV